MSHSVSMREKMKDQEDQKVLSRLKEMETLNNIRVE